MITDQQREQISHLVIRVLYSRFESFPEDASNNRNAPFHEAFLRAFGNELRNKVPDVPYFISLSSWLHGLSTSLGQTFFEGVAHILSGGNKKSFTSKQRNLLSWTSAQQEAITQLVENLRNTRQNPNYHDENQLLEQLIASGDQRESISFTADVFIQSENRIVAIELKSVKPNAGEVRGEKQKILEARAALMHSYRGYKIDYRFGFPFDPTSDTPTGYDKNRFLNALVDGQKYLDPDEILLSAELWDFLSGHANTMDEILSITSNRTPNKSSVGRKWGWDR